MGRAFSKEVTIHNMGRKAVTLTLTNEKNEEIKKAFSKGRKKASEGHTRHISRHWILGGASGAFLTFLPDPLPLMLQVGRSLR